MKQQEEKKYITVEQKMLTKLRWFLLLIFPAVVITVLILSGWLLKRNYIKSFEEAFAVYTARQDKELMTTARGRSVDGYINDYNTKMERKEKQDKNFKRPVIDEEKFRQKIAATISDEDAKPESQYDPDLLQHPKNAVLKKMYADITLFNIITGIIDTKTYNIHGHKVTFKSFVSDYIRDEYGRRVPNYKIVTNKIDGLPDREIIHGKDGKPIYTKIYPLEEQKNNSLLMACGLLAVAYFAGYSFCIKRPPFYTYHGSAKWAESFDLIFTHDTKKIYEIDLVNVVDGVILGRFDAPFMEYRYYERKNRLFEFTKKKLLETLRKDKNGKTKYKGKEYKNKDLLDRLENSRANIDFHKLIPLIPEVSSGQSVYKKHFERIWKPEQLILKDDSKTHVIVAAPTRTGKGVSIITTTLLEWMQSVFVLDIKGENYQNTAYCRKNRWNNIIIRYAPKSDNSSSYNPLGEIRLMTNKEAEDIMNIANIVTTKDKPDPFWDTSASSLLRACITRIVYEVFFNNPIFEDAIGNRVPRELISDETFCTKYFPVVEGNLGQVFDYLVSSQFNLPRIAILKMQSTVEDFFSYCKDEKLVKMIQNRLCQIYPNFKELIAGGKPLDEKEAVKLSGINNLPGMGQSQFELPKINNFTKMDYTKMNPDGSFVSENVPHEIKWHTGRKHPEVVSGFTDSSQASENTTSTIIKVTTTCISLFGLPTVRKNTSTSDFRIRDLMFYRKPMSLYLVVLPADILDVAPLVRIMIVQLVNGLTPEQDYRNEVKPPHKLLMLLDEFPAIGKIEVLETAAGFVAGYGMKLMLINQSLDQLFQIYGEKNKFMGNCQLQIFYTSNDNGTGEYVSKAIGNETIRLVTNKNMHSLFHKNTSSPSEQFTGTPLISTDQLRRLPLNKILIILGGKTPIMTEKIRYFTDPQFMYWSKNIPLIGTESCYNIDRQYTYNNPAYTLADIEFLTGDNRTKYVPYREQLDDEWQYAEKDSEIEKMNLFERIWLINQSRISENARLKGWQYKGRKEGQLSLKMYEIEPDLDIETARYMNAKAMLKKAGYLDENGNYNKNKIKNYRYEKVDDPLQTTRSLEHFIRVNDTDIAGKGGKLVLAGQKTEFITTEQILKKCLDFYLKNRHLEKAAGSTQKFDRNANEELRRKARENKARLEREKELNKVTADDEMTSASQSETVLKGERTTITEARKTAGETKFEGMSQGLEESDIATTVKEHKDYVEADYKIMYGEDYMANPEYWFRIGKCTEEQCVKEMMNYLGSAWNDTVSSNIKSFYAMYGKESN